MQTVRLAVVGAAGRMGRAIAAVAQSEGSQIVAQFRNGDQIAGRDADVLIDFSSAAALEEVCAVATNSRVPLVIGTTGHSKADRALIEATAKTVPIVLASNFSVGVNVLFALVEQAAKALGDGFDVEIIEAHHRMKKDAPSGTARTLVEILQRARALGAVRCGREGNLGERECSEIGVHSIRGGDMVGDHTVIFVGEGERLELTHRASSRETFARGALRAARWVIGKPAGLYSMLDVLEHGPLPGAAHR